MTISKNYLRLAIWIGYLLIGLFLISACSPKVAEKAGSSDSEDRLENKLLWEISGNKLSTPSYLFGTIHLIDSESFFLPEGLLTAFDRSRSVVFEIDMAEMNDMSAMMGIMQRAFMAGGVTLKDLINTEDYQIVESHFNEMGLPFFMLDRIKPMFLTILSDPSIAGGDGMDLMSGGGGMKSYEVELNKMAEAAGKPVSGLETIDFQMSLFDSIPYTIQAEMLVETIKNPGTMDGVGSLEQITQIYVRQDIEEMVSMVNDDSAGFGDHTDFILKNRNIAWIAPMIEKMEKGSVFFAVGAGHLAGDYGVIRLLRNEGYTVKPFQP